ncbi:MAG: hypothetical protein HND48_10235 [Chloroflexi bacterium]|nr:hypothetical protein [Chloroflexota bacterium]
MLPFISNGALHDKADDEARHGKDDYARGSAQYRPKRVDNGLCTVFVDDLDRHAINTHADRGSRAESKGDEQQPQSL